MKKIKNPLSVILGSILQYLRKEDNRNAGDISELLRVSDSAYRMIEAGSANLNIGKTIDLIRIGCFQNIRLDKLSKLLVAIYYLESYKANYFALEEGLKELFTAEKELSLAFSFILDNKEIDLEKSNTLKAAVDHEETRRSILNFLTKKQVINLQELKKELENIQDNTPCIYNFLVKDSLSTYRKEIENLEQQDSLDEKIRKLEMNVKKYKGITFNFQTDENISWQAGREFETLFTVFSNVDTLLDEEILMKYSYVHAQLWKEHLRNFKYIVVHDDPIGVNRIFEKRMERLRKFYDKNVQSPFDFYYGWEKIKFKVIPTSHEGLKELNISGKGDEVWFYKEKGEPTFAMTHHKTEHLHSRHNFSYTILTNKEIAEAEAVFNKLWASS